VSAGAGLKRSLPMVFSVCLEIADDGRCMAHVMDLPGCIARAETREAALSRVLQAIREYDAWLRRHGEAVLPPHVPLELRVGGEARGLGPFDPGDAAALFPPDREALDQEEMQRFFSLMAYSRVDLLGLALDLPDELLDWEPGPGSFSIRRVLRHVGNAEEWYVSRIVPADRLPPEWQDDEAMPTFEFLAMERRRALEALHALDDEQQSGIFYPSAWTDHPEEPWTARKVLRRFIEHELEHVGQVAEILVAAGWPRAL
jgi:uncharacterized damage-inducible protein DinB/predicted RNase H-like HicB family nuclease